jgi:Ca-activated chloride channel family protein
MVKAIGLTLAATTVAILATGFQAKQKPKEVVWWDENPPAVSGTRAQPMLSSEPEPGQLTIMQKDGKVGNLCPLERTSVQANVVGFGAEVKVTQIFHNPTQETIEAIYTFPLPNDAAVNDMTLKIADRTVKGLIKRREEARRIYDAAKQQGQTAALLDQERPNIFTQSVANITPGAEIHVEISYVQALKFQDGTFEFNFPMVVGPRYLGNAADPDKIAPPITPEGTRTGANIDLAVTVDAGAPIQSVKSVLHEVSIKRINPKTGLITLAKQDEIPNRDFILRYSVATDQVTDAVAAHMDPDKGGFLAMALLPPKAPKEEDATPREVIFVMDQSGSQNGFPIEKSKELTLKLIETLRPGDTFNVMGFNTSVRALWTSPRANTPENLKEARAFVGGMHANGGTHIREGVVAALSGQDDPKRLRLVVFNTDGYVGDEKVILDTIQKTRGTARMFVFGIGNGVNRFLLDEMAEEGRGGVEYVTLAEQADEAVARFIKRTRTPVLTDVSVEFDGVEVEGVEPKYLPDVFDESPVYIYGRYLNPGKGKMTIRGKQRGQPWSRTVDLDLPMASESDVAASLWARNRVDSLARENWVGQFNGEGKNVAEEITQLGLDFSLMTDYTSFVAVEERVVNIGGKQRTIRVPVEMTDGVSYQGSLGMETSIRYYRTGAGPRRGAGGGGFGGGGGGGGGLPAGQANAPSSFGSIADSDSAGLRVVRKPEDKIDKKLKSVKGKLEVQVWLTKWDDALITKLTGHGLKIELKDKKLMIVFGTVEANKLLELAKLEDVQRIGPLEE